MGWPTTLWSTGDLGTAAWANALPSIIDQKVDAAASYDFTSIPQVYEHLLIYAALLSTSGNNLTNMWLRFNGNTGNNYTYQTLSGSGASATASTGTTTQGIIANAGGIAGTSPSPMLILIPNYTAATPHQAVSFFIGGSSTLNTGVWGFTFAVSDAITQVELGGAVADGSIATLYGMGSG